MKKMRIVITGAMSALALGLAGVVAAAPAQAAELGGLNLNAYCKALIGTYAVNYENNPYYWFCNGSSTWPATRIDMHAACAWTYGRGATARLLDAGNPYAWRCFR